MKKVRKIGLMAWLCVLGWVIPLSLSAHSVEQESELSLALSRFNDGLKQGVDYHFMEGAKSMVQGESLREGKPTLSFSRPVKAEKVVLSACGLRNLYRIDEGVYRSDQPTSADFKALQQFGMGEVLNLRNRHSDDDEAEGTSMKLHRVRMRAHAVSEKKLIEALRIIHHRKAPILIHCHHGSDRTGAVCALYRILFQNVSKEQAIEEMVHGGFGFHRIYRNLIRRIRKADIERIRQAVLAE